MSESTITSPVEPSFSARKDWRVADLSTAPFGRKEISLAEHEMPGLMALRKEYAVRSRSPAPASPARCT